MLPPSKPPLPLLLIGGVFGLGIALGGGIGYVVRSSEPLSPSPAAVVSGSSAPVALSGATFSESDASKETGEKAKSTNAAKAVAAQLKARALNDQNKRFEAIRVAASHQPKKDLEGNINDVMQMPESPKKYQMIEQLIYHIAQTNPVYAMDLVDKLPVGHLQDQSLERLANFYVIKDPQEALAWANQQTDEHIKNLVMGVVANVIVDETSQSDPKGALVFAQSLPAGKFRDDAIINAMGQYAGRNPREALDYAQLFPAGDARDNMIGRCINSWAQTDPQAASTWVLSLPDGETKNNAIQNICNQIVDSDPMAAIQLNSSISDPNKRDSFQRNTAHRWLQNDPAAATQWINNSSIPPEFKKQLLQQK